jgi:hypothetical protein
MVMNSSGTPHAKKNSVIFKEHTNIASASRLSQSTAPLAYEHGL